MPNKIEWLIAFLAANNNESIKGITRFEKLLYLYLNKFKYFNDAESFGFEAYRFGPHSDSIRDLLYALRDRDLLYIIQKPTDSLLELDTGDEIKPINYDKREIYKLTPKGQEIAKKVIQRIPDFKHLTEFKKRFSSVELNKLIRIVYTEFPRMTTKSEILKKIL